jgi:hypothetical protein
MFTRRSPTCGAADPIRICEDVQFTNVVRDHDAVRALDPREEAV